MAYYSFLGQQKVLGPGVLSLKQVFGKPQALGGIRKGPQNKSEHLSLGFPSHSLMHSDDPRNSAPKTQS